jgi:hypothetical protein
MVAEGLTQLDEVVDCQQELHFLRDGLHGGGAKLLICPREGLGILVARVQQGADNDIVQVPTEVREIPMACRRRNRSHLTIGLKHSYGPSHVNSLNMT